MRNVATVQSARRAPRVKGSNGMGCDVTIFSRSLENSSCTEDLLSSARSKCCEPCFQERPVCPQLRLGHRSQRPTLMLCSSENTANLDERTVRRTLASIATRRCRQRELQGHGFPQSLQRQRPGPTDGLGEGMGDAVPYKPRSSQRPETFRQQH